MTQMNPSDIVPLHEVSDYGKVLGLTASMRNHGWTGSPLVVISGQDVRAVTGAHRRAAAFAAEIDVPVTELDDILAEHGTSLAALIAEYGDEYEALTRLCYHLPADVVDEYGLDVE